MKKMAKLFTLLLVLSLMASIFTGCAKDTADSDLSYIKDKGVLVVGITDFAPMDYQDADGNWIGFDADLAKAFADSLGVKVEFVEINWGTKEMELENKGIDCVWNGMTLTDGVKAAMSTSDPYCKNAQVVVVNQAVASQYQTTESLFSLNFIVEDGSAGAEALDALGIPYLSAETQADALLEVASGSADACVIDLLMAGAMISEGTSYPDLVFTVSLNYEEYGVGFRKGSDLTEKLNAFFAENGELIASLAQTYGIQDNIIATK